MSLVNVKCLFVLSRYLSPYSQVIINVFVYMLNVCFCCPVYLIPVVELSLMYLVIC